MGLSLEQDPNQDGASYKLAPGFLRAEETEGFPSFSEMVQAAFMRENIVGNMFLASKYTDWKANTWDEPEFHALNEIQGTRYAPFKNFFADVRNSHSLASRMRYIDALVDQQRILERAGPTGLGLSIAAAVFDPINLIPIGGGVAAARSTTSLFRMAGRSAKIGTIANLAQELPLKSFQPTRTWTEVGANVAGGAVISGALGGAAGKLARMMRGKPAHDPDLLAIAQDRLKGMEEDVDRAILREQIAGKEADEDAVLRALKPMLDDIMEANPTTGREIVSIIQQAAPDIAAGRIGMRDVADAIEQIVPVVMSGSGVRLTVAAAHIDDAVRMSRIEPEPSASPNLKGPDTPGTTTRIAYRPQPQPRSDQISGFQTRVMPEDKAAELRARQEQGAPTDILTIQLDAPTDLVRGRGVVFGVTLKINRQHIFDPDGLIPGTPRLPAEEADRVLKAIRGGRSLRKVLRAEGWEGFVHMVETPHTRTRELVFLYAATGDRATYSNKGNGVAFDQLPRNATTHDLQNLERHLRIPRSPVAGGSQSILTGLDGRLIMSEDELFEALNNPGSEFMRLGNAERTDGKINVNGASVADLLKIVGLGPKRANAIHEFIQQHGPITSLNQLAEVEGIGAKTMTDIKKWGDLADQAVESAMETRLKNAFGFEQVAAIFSPVIRIMVRSRSETARRLTSRLFEIGGVHLESDRLVRQALPVETLIKNHQVKFARSTRVIWDLYLQYLERVGARVKKKGGSTIPGQAPPVRTAGTMFKEELKSVRRNPRQLWDAEEVPNDANHLTPTEFRRRVGLALFFGDTDAFEKVASRPGMEWMREAMGETSVSEVSRAAAAIRGEMLDPLFAEARLLGLITDADMRAVQKTGQTYFHRVFNNPKIQSEQTLIEDAIAKFLTEERAYAPDVARAEARRMVLAIMETPSGRIPYDIHRLGKTGALRSRTVDIPDEVLLPWLETDVDAVMRLYLRTMAPDIELAKFVRSLRHERMRKLARIKIENDRNFGSRKAADHVLETERQIDSLEREIAYLAKLHQEGKRLSQKNAPLPPEMRAAFERMGAAYRDYAKRMKTLGWRAEEVEDIFKRYEDGQPRWAGEEGRVLDDLEEMKGWIDEDYDRQRVLLADQMEQRRATRQQMREAESSLNLRRQKDKDEIITMIQLLRNTHVHPWDASIPANRFMRGLRRWNVLTMGGGFMISSIPDVGRLVLANGMGSLFGDVLRPFINDMNGSRAALRAQLLELRDLGVAWEIILNNRASLMTEVQARINATGIETVLERGADLMFLINGMSIWNDVMKETAALLTHFKISRAAEMAGQGKRIPNLDALRQLGLDERLLRRIDAELKRNTTDVVNGARLTKFSDWQDDLALASYQTAMKKQVDNLIITPGVGDRPLMMSSEVIKTWLQFKSFALAATTRLTLAGLQQRDVLVAQQVAMMWTLGVLTYALKQIQYGSPISTDPRDLLVEGVDRAGLPAILSEVDALIAGFSGGNWSAARMIGARTPSRFMARRGLPGKLFGPSYSRVPQLGGLIEAISSADAKPSDIRHIRNMIFYQNVFYMDWLFDMIEQPLKRSVSNRRRAGETP